MDLSNSINIYILQCYTLLFSYIGLINNLGNYFILSIIILYICFKPKKIILCIGNLLDKT